MKSSIITHVSQEIALTEEEEVEFISILSEKKLKAKSYLIRPGDQVSEEFYVVKGCLIAYCLDDFGNKHILQFAIEDWWISDFEAFFNNLPAKLFVEAVEDCELLGI